MAASRAASARSLQQLTKVGRQQYRQLYLTGSASISSKASKISGQEASSDNPHTTGRKRTFSTGSGAEPVTRSSSTQKPTTPSTQTRHFNTSRAHKSPKDTSTIDFAFLPAEVLAFPSNDPAIRVPLLPQNFTPIRTGVHANPLADFDNVHRVEITTAAADSTHINVPSAMSEVHDNNAASVDFHEVAEGLEGVMKGMEDVVADMKNDAPGVVRQLWDGVVEDVLGRKGTTRLA